MKAFALMHADPYSFSRNMIKPSIDSFLQAVANEFAKEFITGTLGKLKEAELRAVLDGAPSVRFDSCCLVSCD